MCFFLHILLFILDSQFATGILGRSFDITKIASETDFLTKTLQPALTLQLSGNLAKCYSKSGLFHCYGSDVTISEINQLSCDTSAKYFTSSAEIMAYIAGSMGIVSTMFAVDPVFSYLNAFSQSSQYAMY